MNGKDQIVWLAVVALVATITLALGSDPASARLAEPELGIYLPASMSAQEPGRKPPVPSRPRISVAAIMTATTSQHLAEAMGIEASSIISASLNGSDMRALGIGTRPLGKYFPTEGNTFAILSTGLAASAEWPNNEENLSFILDGLDNSQGEDLVQLALQLRVPEGMNCAAFDFAFYSEEFPEFVGSRFNDTFTAELGGTNLIISGTEVTAPLNFAFDTEGNPISINTVFGVTSHTGSTYDSVTPLLRAHTQVNPGAVTTIVFSIQDLGDPIYDSAVFLDHFTWSDDPDCGQGTVITTHKLFLPIILKDY
jgi:hypothetical protein